MPSQLEFQSTKRVNFIKSVAFPVANLTKFM
jgi:hypothetical protein